MADPQRDVLLQRNAILPEKECKDCRWWEICHGGCPLDAWSASGSFLHKTEWCRTKQIFIEKYFEPTVNPGSTAAPGSTAEQGGDAATIHKPAVTFAPLEEPGANGHIRWINPIGGLGDVLMIAGILKQLLEKFPSRKFNLVDRTKYRLLLEGHPAIQQIGNPPPDADFVTTNYWDCDDFERGERAYQVLARIFGLEPPVQERLYVPGELQDDPLLLKAIPWKRFNVLIGQSSESPRKQMGIDKWESLVAMLSKEEVLSVQATRLHDRYIRGTYSLLGLTTPRELISLLRHFDLVLTCDSFLMHAAHLCGVPAVVLWGPTDHRVYGYSGQIHLQGKTDCEYPGGCIRPGHGGLYTTDCPEGSSHCTNTIPLETIYSSVMSVLKKGPSPHTAKARLTAL